MSMLSPIAGGYVQQAPSGLTQREIELSAREAAVSLAEESLEARIRTFDAEMQRRREALDQRELELNTRESGE